MSTLTQHTPSPHRPVVQLAEPLRAADRLMPHRDRVRDSSRVLRLLNAAAVVSVAVSLATLQAADYRLSAILLASALVAKVSVIVGRRRRSAVGPTLTAAVDSRLAVTRIDR